MQKLALVLWAGSLTGCCLSAGTSTSAPMGAGSVVPAEGEAAEAAEVPVRSDVPAQLEGASMSMDSMTLNGQELAGLSCTGSFNLFGGNPAGAVAEQSAALTACVAGAASRPRVHFAFTAGAVSDVRVADAPTPAAARCIAGVLSALQPPGDGACVMTVVLGG